MEQTFVVTYKGGRDKGFAVTEKFIKAKNKTQARNKLLDEVPGAVVKKVEPLI
jgi:hypothetical protein